MNRSTHINLITAGAAEAEAVLLIHPVGCDLTHWEAQIEALRDTYQVLAFDLPGHGLSDGEPDDFTFDAMAEAAFRVLSTTGKQAAHVIGISVGGMIAQTFALAYPSATLSLTLIATAATFPDTARDGMCQRARDIADGGLNPLLSPTMQRWFTQKTILERPHVRDRASKVFLSTRASVHASMWTMISTFDTSARLAEITCPTLVIAGADDPGTPVPVVEMIASGIPQSRFVVFPETSHMVTLEQPDALNREIISFLADLRR